MVCRDGAYLFIILLLNISSYFYTFSYIIHLNCSALCTIFVIQWTYVPAIFCLCTMGIDGRYRRRGVRDHGDDDNDGGWLNGVCCLATVNFVNYIARSCRHFVLYRNVSRRTTSTDSPERRVYFYLNRGVKHDEFVFILRRINFSIML